MSTNSITGRPASRLSRRHLLASSVAATTLVTAMSRHVGRAARQTPELGDGGELDAFVTELDATIQEWLVTLEVPGVAVGVIAGGKEYSAGFGVTNIDHPLEVDAETLFQIGSIGKTYTATTIMRLVDAGLIDLDAPVRTYLPEFQVADEAVAEAVTVRQLLNHSAGWLGDVFTDTGNGDDAIALYVEQLSENPQIAPLGEYFSYNNSAFITAGRIIEAVTGQTYLKALTEQVLEPLGLERTFLYPDQVMTEAFATGHTGAVSTFEGDLVVAQPWALPRAVTPAGNHIASIQDLLRYARFHLGDGTDVDGNVVLQPATMAAFSTPTVAGGAVGDVVIDGLAVAWMIREIDRTLVQQHGGSTNGQEALLVLVPERQFALGLLTNASGGAVLNAIVSGWALERYLGLSVPEPAPIELSPSDLGQYLGRYGDGSGGPTFVIGEADGALTATMLIPAVGDTPADGPLEFVGDDLVQIAIWGLPLLADFVRTETGEVGWFRFSGRLQPRVDD